MNELKNVKTLGELRELTKHLPDETPITIDRGFDGQSDTLCVRIWSERNAGDRVVEVS